MKGKTVIIIVLIALATFIVFGVLAGIGFSRMVKTDIISDIPDDISDIRFKNSGLELSEEAHLSLDGVNVIKIGTVSSDVTFIESDSDVDVVLDMKGYFNDNKPELVTGVDGDTMTINVDYPTVGFTSVWSKLSVSIPKDYTGKIIVNSVSADIRGTLFNTLDELNLRTVSGDSDLTLTSVDDVRLGSTSGDYNIDSDITQSLHAESTSGDINVDSIISKAANVYGRTVSGNMNLSYAEACKTELRTTSGNMRIRLPENDGISLFFSSTSGDMNGDVTLDHDGVTFDIRSVSGDLSFD